MVLANCCRDIEARRLPLKFILYGYADIDLRSFAAIRVTGAYEEQRLPHLLKELPCDMVFFPAVWPETFSYTLSEAKDASLYPVSFDIGAIAERIRAYGWGHLIPFELACRPGDINDRLITMSIPKQARSFPLTTAQRPEADFISNYYELHFSAKSI